MCLGQNQEAIQVYADEEQVGRDTGWYEAALESIERSISGVLRTRDLVVSGQGEKELAHQGKKHICPQLSPSSPWHGSFSEGFR